MTMLLRGIPKDLGDKTINSSDIYLNLKRIESLLTAIVKAHFLSYHH